MKYIIFILKHTLDSFRDTFKITKYFHLIKFNGLTVIFKLFLIRFFYAFSFIRNFKLSSKIFNNKFEKKKLIQNLQNINDEIKKIDSQGFSNIFNLDQDFTKKLLFQILNNKKNLNVKKKHNTDLFINNYETESEYIERLKKNDISRLTASINLEDFPILKELILSNEVLYLASNYIGSKSLTINTNYFISVPVETNKFEKYKNAQYFHWDNDFRKFLKLYIYLTDVDEFNGPHVFVEGTHKKKNFKHSLARLYGDEDIFNSYNSIKYFYGNKGSLFFTDSYGIHKGMPPSKKHRIMLNIHFGNDKIKYHQDDLIINL